MGNRDSLFSADRSRFDYSTAKIEINIDITIMKAICDFSMMSNRYVSLSAVKMMKKFLDKIDLSNLSKDNEFMKYFDFAYAALSVREESSNKLQPLWIYTSVYKLNDYNPNKVAQEELEILDDWQLNYILRLAQDSLEKINIDRFAREIKDCSIDLLSSADNRSFEEKDKVRNKLYTLANKLVKENRNLQDAATKENNSFSSADLEGLKTFTSRVYDDLNDPSSNLITGCQAINETLNGGFKKSRLYMFFGVTGMGKSMLMTDLLLQMKKYNHNYKGRYPNKLPTILYLTMENSADETLPRIFDMVKPKSEMIFETTPKDQVLQIINDALKPTAESPIGIDVMYLNPVGITGKDEVDTSVLYDIYEQYLDEGKEIICVIQDHIKQINSSDPTANKVLREKLGAIAAQFKAFAVEMNVPVISLGHLNRSAESIVQNNKKMCVQDSVKDLGREFVGESNSIIQTLDYGYIINTEYKLGLDNDGKYFNKKYCTFLNIKIRQRDSLQYFAMPYRDDNQIKLVEDLYGKARHLKTLSGDIEAETFDQLDGGTSKTVPVEKEDTIKMKNELEQKSIMNNTVQKLNQLSNINNITVKNSNNSAVNDIIHYKVDPPSQQPPQQQYQQQNLIRIAQKISYETPHYYMSILEKFTDDNKLSIMERYDNNKLCIMERYDDKLCIMERYDDNNKLSIMERYDDNKLYIMERHDYECIAERVFE